MKKLNLFFSIIGAILPTFSFASDMLAEPVNNLLQSLAGYYWIFAVAATLVVSYFFFLERRLSKGQSVLFYAMILLLFLWARH